MFLRVLRGFFRFRFTVCSTIWLGSVFYIGTKLQNDTRMYVESYQPKIFKCIQNMLLSDGVVWST